MKKLPKLPEYPTLDEVAAWLTTASDEVWSPPAVLSRLLEWEEPRVLSDGSLSQSRITTSREVWVVVPPGDAVTVQLDGAEWVTREGLLVYVLEPIDSFVRTVWLCGEAVPTGGVSTRDGKRFHVTRSFSVHDVRIPKNDVFKLLPAFDQLMLELDRGEHADLARLVDDVAHSSVVNPTNSNRSVGEQDVEDDSRGRLDQLAEKTRPSKTTIRVPKEQPVRDDFELITKEVQRRGLGMATMSYAAKSVQKKKQDFVREVVDQVEAFCRQNRIKFDRQSMPGDAGDLFWLMEKLHPGKFDMQAKSFQDHYRGVCSWPRGAGHQDGARSLYLRVFPEIFPPIIGAKSAPK